VTAQAHAGGTRTGWLLGAACFVVVVAGMRAAAPLLVPFLLALFIAVITAPPMFWLKKRGLPTGLSLLAVIAALVAAVVGISMLAASSIEAFSRQGPVYEERLHERMSGVITWLSGLGLDISHESIRQHIDPGAAMKVVGGVVSGLGDALTNSFLILITVIFVLLEASSLPAKLRAALDDPEASLDRFTSVAANVNRYLAIKTWTSVATGVLVWIFLAVLGVDFALLWALAAFLLNYVPSLGAILATIPPVLQAWVQLGDGSALAVLIGYVVINVLIGNVIEPRFMGRGLGLSTLVVFLSLIFWGWVLGPVGMLLSIPLTMTVRIALEARPETRGLAILLGPEPVAAAAPVPATATPAPPPRPPA
jgi:predicted PurR-regulated permease PerM